ncbi:MAG: TolC family protein [Methylococcaceae bacterium]
MSFKRITKFSLLLTFLLTACATYQAKPLNTEQSKNSVSEQLTIQVKQLKHPLLKTIDFNLNDGVSPDEAAIIAVLKNSELQLARNKQSIAGAQLLQAGLLPNPSIAYNFLDTTGGLDKGKVAGYGLSLNWEITALLTQDNKISAAKADYQAINLQIAWQEWQIAQAAKSACYQLQVYNQQQALLGANLKRLDTNNAQLKQAQALGLVTELESMSVLTAQTSLESRLQAVIQQKEIQQQRFNRALGLQPQELISIQAQLLPDSVNVANYQQLTKNLAEQRLDLLALKQSYQAQEAQLQSAVLQQFPKISIGITHSKNNSDYYTMGAGVSLSLPVFDQNQGAIALATASRQMVFDEYHNRDFQSKADIAELLVTIEAVNTELKNAHKALLSLEALLKAYDKASEQEQIDNIAYYSAWNAVSDKQVDILSLQLHLIEARIALETATGRYLL